MKVGRICSKLKIDTRAMLVMLYKCLFYTWNKYHSGYFSGLLLPFSIYFEILIHKLFFSEKNSKERTFSDESTSIPNMIENKVSNQPVIERHSVLHESFNAIVKSSEVSEQPRESSSTLLTTRNLKAQSVLRTRLAGFPLPSPTEIPLDFDAYLVEFTKEENTSIGLSLVPALSDRFLGFFQI